jgi:hypothetical protein
VSELASPRDKQRAVDAGFDAYITRQFGASDVINTIVQVLNDAAKRAAQPMFCVPVDWPDPTGPGVCIGCVTAGPALAESAPCNTFERLLCPAADFRISLSRRDPQLGVFW